MKIFLTGTESFIGAMLWGMLLKAGHEVTGMDLAPPTQPGTIQMDLRDRRLVEQIPEGAAIIHLAAMSTEGACKANPLEAMDINLTGTLRLAQAAVKRKCQQLIFASTEWVYPDVTQHELQKEDSPLDAMRPMSVYAFTKLAGERMLALSGLANVTLLRFGIVYGPREKNWSAVESLVEKVRRGESAQVGSFQTARRFVHVSDLCRGIIASLGRRGVEIFNLPGDRLINLGEVLTAGQAVLGKEVECRETTPDKPSVRNPDNAKARDVLGWTPRVPLATGVKELLDYLEKRASHG